EIASTADMPMQSDVQILSEERACPTLCEGASKVVVVSAPEPLQQVFIEQPDRVSVLDVAPPGHSKRAERAARNWSHRENDVPLANGLGLMVRGMSRVSLDACEQLDDLSRVHARNCGRNGLHFLRTTSRHHASV